jgi:hypothetical protein
MLIKNFILISIIIIGLGILYQRYLDKNSFNDDYSDIQKYLLKDNKYLLETDKPILWIHIPYEYNSRKWLDFGSRSSIDLNQPYIYLTIRSIIKNCENSFKIVLIDDLTFEKLIPNWTINMERIPDPSKCYIRQLAITKLIYIYGGMNVPLSFLCLKNLLSMYENGIKQNKMFVCEKYNSNVSSDRNLFYPNCEFIGSEKENPTVKELINFMEINISSNFTNELVFLGKFNTWCLYKINENKINLINGHLIGTKNVENEAILLDNLLSDEYINFYSNIYGIWVPNRDILKRTYYEWFARMSPEQIFESQFILAKYMVISLAPESSPNMIEGMENDPRWIDFWKVPLTNNTLNIFGPKPIYLGNNISRGKPIDR